MRCHQASGTAARMRARCLRDVTRRTCHCQSRDVTGSHAPQ